MSARSKRKLAQAAVDFNKKCDFAELEHDPAI